MRNVKCVLVGSSRVGKTALLIAYTTNTSIAQCEYIPRRFDNYSANVRFQDHIFSLGLWDIIDNPDYDSLRPLSYPQTDIFVLCFSIANRTSFELITTKWCPEISVCPEAKITLVGTKSDLRTQFSETDNFIICLMLKNLKFEFGSKKHTVVLSHDVSRLIFVIYFELWIQQQNFIGRRRGSDIFNNVSYEEGVSLAKKNWSLQLHGMLCLFNGWSECSI